jgi:iron complex outermembrane receptor protein
MEERSPGSYRFSIRGSTLRSPFGVRNVKMYWNELPLTDPGGNTYLNQLDPATIARAEVIKGPGSSLYGSGTGGVVLLTSPVAEDDLSFTGGVMSGSYGLVGYNLGLREAGEQSRHTVQYAHQRSDGYREQSRMVRDMVNSTFRFDLKDGQSLEAVLLYSDLYYQTPGGLNLTEAEADPTQARPTTSLPGAVDQNAHVGLRSFYAGVLHHYRFGERAHNRTGVYGNFVQFSNAAIRNYEQRAEQNLGVRSVTSYHMKAGTASLDWIGGLEFQHGYSPISTYQNLSGVAGTLLTDDEVGSTQFNLFGQLDIHHRPWTLTGGLGVNWVGYTFDRYSTQPSQPAQSEEKIYTPFFAPRVAVSRLLGESNAVYASVSRGFSPPTSQEVYPSTNQFNSTLQPETGTQLEAGVRGSALNEALRYDLTLYHFELDETIVVRRAADGADYFVNAGSTRQNGAEISLAWKKSLGGFLKELNLWSGASFQYYYFDDYMKDTVSYSGNRMTGVPRQIINGGIDVNFGRGGYLRCTINYTGDLPLNDANSVFAERYVLLGGRAGWKTWLGAMEAEVFVAGENLLDEQYSLGHDLNAAGGRYYNPAAALSVTAGVNVRIPVKRQKEPAG